MTHYETLGVEPSASAADIKAAYRRKSSAAHPDREGGSVEAQQAVNDAYAVLGDPDRRSRYDATGDDKAPVSIEAKARDALLALFHAVIDGDGDMVHAVHGMLSQHRTQTNTIRHQAVQRRAKLLKRREKVKVKSGNNLVHGLIDQAVVQLDVQIATATEGLEINAAALAMLSDYEFDGSEPAPESYVSQRVFEALNWGPK